MDAALMTATATSNSIDRDPAATAISNARARVASVDVVRGVVMVLMVLDHVRDFFTNVKFEPTDLSRTWPSLFFTRWITHFCAPVFVLLAGVGSGLSRSAGKSKNDLARFLFTRGLWLVFLELTIVNVSWTFDLGFPVLVGQVIWALGWSMVALAALVFVPTWGIFALGSILVLAHNALDSFRPAEGGLSSAVWHVVHQQGMVNAGGSHKLFIVYPLVPWIGVMALGYILGLGLPKMSDRARFLMMLGGGSTLAFIALRGLHIYGDPRPFALRETTAQTVMAFFNCEKYPPSLQYLTMTLGPAIFIWGLVERRFRARELPGLLRPIVVFGRVPLFFYLIHIPFIHALAFVYSSMAFGEGIKSPFQGAPAGYGFSLPIVYAIWVAVVVALYPGCAAFSRLKATRKSLWLSYL